MRMDSPTCVLLLGALFSLATTQDAVAKTPPLTGWPYTCVWNSPTAECEGFGYHFNLSVYDIIQNSGDAFYGDKMVIFYGIGKFPVIDHKTGKYYNGGIPQLGNLTAHLEQVVKDVDSKIPSQNFSGLAVIDFESWRPLFQHNFDSLAIYQRASEELVAKQHPDWNKTQVEEEAEREFNRAARLFFESTINTTKKLRPLAHWGYYGFPRCYGQPGNYCSPGAQADNNKLQWLWDASSALYPRIYLSQESSQSEHTLYLMSTVHEAVRVGGHRTSGERIPTYPYSKHSYDHGPGHFYSPEDLWLSHAISSFLGATGVVIWGSTKSVQTSQLCAELKNYTTAEFGPFVRNFTLWTQDCSLKLCSEHGQCVAGVIPKLEILEDSDFQYLEMEFLEKTMRMWEEYFASLVRPVLEGDGVSMATDTENYSCQCFEGWTGKSCSQSTH